MKKLLFIILCIVIAVTSKAQTADFSAPNSDGVTLYYNITDASQHAVEVTNAYGRSIFNELGGTIPWASYIKYTAPIIRVPETVTYAGNTYTVTKCGDDAFIKGEMTQIVLPNTVKDVGKNCFYDCYQLSNINLPEGIISIGKSAFWGNQSLHSVIFPSTLKTAGSWLFRNSAIEYIYNLENTQLTELPEQFAGMNARIKAVTLPATLKKINSYSLMQSKFSEITIPAGVQEIGCYALGQVFTLKKIVMEPITPPTGCGYIENSSDLKIYVATDATQPYESAAEWLDYKGKYYEKVSFGTSGYTTYYLENENFKVPTGCTAYIITGVTPNNQAIVKAFGAGKIIPKQTGFVLQGLANTTVTYQANVSGTEEDVTGNLLVGTATELQFSSAGHKYYIFAMGGQGPGFYKQGTRGGASIKLKPHRAGLCLDEAVAPAKSLIIDFDAARREAETTGIHGVRPEMQRRDNAVYDLQGRRVVNPTHGIYIINGKKIIK